MHQVAHGGSFPRSTLAQKQSNSYHAAWGFLIRFLSIFVQILIATAGWLVFGWLWTHAILVGPSAAELHSTLVVLIINTVVLAVTVLWIAWNKNIYRRKGPRSAVPEVDFAYKTDALGAVVDVRASTTGYDRLIVVHVRQVGPQRVKVFEPDHLPGMTSGEA